MEKINFDSEGRVIVPNIPIEPRENKIKTKNINSVILNGLALELSSKIQKIFDVKFKDEQTMRCFYSDVDYKNKPLGLCWLEPHKDGSLVVYFRKSDYSSIDTRGLIEYSTIQRKTFGDYPLIKISNSSELDFVLEIIKLAYRV